MRASVDVNNLPLVPIDLPYDLAAFVAHLGRSQSAHRIREAWDWHERRVPMVRVRDAAGRATFIHEGDLDESRAAARDLVAGQRGESAGHGRSWEVEAVRVPMIVATQRDGDPSLVTERGPYLSQDLGVALLLYDLDGFRYGDPQDHAVDTYRRLQDVHWWHQPIPPGQFVRARALAQATQQAWGGIPDAPPDGWWSGQQIGRWLREQRMDERGPQTRYGAIAGWPRWTEDDARLDWLVYADGTITIELTLGDPLSVPAVRVYVSVGGQVQVRGDRARLTALNRATLVGMIMAVLVNIAVDAPADVLDGHVRALLTPVADTSADEDGDDDRSA